MKHYPIDQCFDYIDGYSTAFQPIYRRQCYCKATACLFVRAKVNKKGKK